MSKENKDNVIETIPVETVEPVELTEQTEITESAKGYSNWVEGLNSSPKGKPYQTIQNALFALDNCPELAGIISYNEFTGSVEILGAGWKRYSNRITDADFDFIYLAMEKGGITSRDKINSAVNIKAMQNAYHPVQILLKSLKWDEEDHLSELFPKYLGAERSEYTTIITQVLFGGIIGRTFCPGMKFDTAVVLTDTKQGGGKSTMCRLLAIRDEWYTSLKSVDDQKVTVETITGHLVVELEEMEGLVTAKSIETVRGFLSRPSDTYRTPYARFSQDILRGSVCIGTSNDPAFLPMDRAGNRRFLPIKCNKDKAEAHPLDDEEATRKDILQCYAQAMCLYRNHELPVKLPPEWEKELPEKQKDFLPEDLKAVKIEQWILDNSKPEYCVLMIYQEALGNKNGTPKQWESKEIAVILDNLKNEDGTIMLKRYDGSGGIKRIKDYGRCKAWVKNGDSFVAIPEASEHDEQDLPFD